MTYGKTVIWNAGSDCYSVSGFPTQRSALITALRGARRLGWAPPRLWQFWRWGDRDYRHDLISVRKAK